LINGGESPPQRRSHKRRRYRPGSSCGWEAGAVCALAFPAALGRWPLVWSRNFQIKGFVPHQRHRLLQSHTLHSFPRRGETFFEVLTKSQYQFLEARG
jgi:hypothetical protein